MERLDQGITTEKKYPSRRRMFYVVANRLNLPMAGEHTENKEATLRLIKALEDASMGDDNTLKAMYDEFGRDSAPEENKPGIKRGDSYDRTSRPTEDSKSSPKKIDIRV